MKLLKYQGCGNDFVLFDTREVEHSPLTAAQVTWICDRHYGVGADGLAVLLPSEKANVRWIFYNCDGKEAEMCGNAARCVFSYLGLPHATLETARGVIQGEVLQDGSIAVCFPFFQERLPEAAPHFLRNPQGHVWTIYPLNTGVPHAVLEVEDLSTTPVHEQGREILRHAYFQPEQTNVTFFQRQGMGIRSTTFERGVEAQTLACGTGMLAAAVVFSQLYATPFPIEAEVPGGRLSVDYRPGKGLFLRGAAHRVFETEVELPPHFQQPRPFGAGR